MIILAIALNMLSLADKSDVDVNAFYKY